MNILVVDDDPITLRVVSALLSEQGHHVSVAHDGVEGLAVFEQEKFSVVVTDWIMPRMDGLELVKCIRAKATLSYTYVIFLTAKGDHGDAVHALSAGADDLLAKPVQQVDLIARLRVSERIMALQEQLIARNKALENVNQRLKHDLESAGRVQRSLLPARPLGIPGWQAAWRLMPCEQLAGDTLNVFRLDEHRLAGFVLDVSGHGVSSSLLAVQASRFLSPLMLAPFTSPLDLLRSLAGYFPFSMESPQFFTIVYAVIDLRSGDVVVASAGHPGPLVVRANAHCESYELVSSAIGLLPADHCTFAEMRLHLDPGDRLVLYSDGMSEASNAQGENFSTTHIMDALERGRDRDLQQSLDALLAEVQTFSGSMEYRDDISVLAIERS